MCCCTSSDRSSSSGASGAPNSNTPPSATQTCPGSQFCCSTTRWIDAQAFCGDNARLEANISGSPPDGPATVEVLHPTNGSVVETINTNMTGGRITATWMTKAQTANWRTDRHRFRVRAAGLTCTSSNEFTFRQRPTTNWILKNVTHPSAGGFAPAHEKHDARLEADRVHYSLKFRTYGDPFDAAKQSAAKTLIENVWNNGFNNKKFHRTRCGRGRSCNCTFDCCKAGFRLDVNFVTTGEHVAIQIFATLPGAPMHRSGLNGDGGEWGDPALSPTTTYPHETGHVLGQHDEYPTGATDPTGVQPANATTPNLMSTPGNTALFNVHYRHALAFLNSNANGDPYEIIPP